MSSCPRCDSILPAADGGACPRCLLERPLPAAQLGDYLELGDVVGEGGMGSVFRARDTRLDRDVAVKILPLEIAAEAELHERFEREAKALALLNHPNIVGVYGFGQDDGQPYIVMEFVDGKPLSEMLPLAPERAIEITATICEALAYAHERGVIHRDVKPANVLVSTDGVVKVADFGIARVVGNAGAGWTVTRDNVAVGTPAYMAPEILEGAAPDARMDVFSVGVLLYRAITGRLPGGEFETLPAGLDPVVRKAMAADPAERYADAPALLTALRTLGSTEADDLPPDQRSWLRAVALIQAIASAIALWAFWIAVTPKVISADEVRPLIMLVTEPLADGRLISRARFEIWPTLGATAAVGFAIAAYAVLRRHWRLAGLERKRPRRVVREARIVFAIGIFQCGVYLLHRLVLVDATRLAAFVPIFGGLLELVTLWYFWMAILELWRNGRPLHHEWRLWLGMGLSMVPPVSDLLSFITNWHP